MAYGTGRTTTFLQMNGYRPGAYIPLPGGPLTIFLRVVHCENVVGHEGESNTTLQWFACSVNSVVAMRTVGKLLTTVEYRDVFNSQYFWLDRVQRGLK